MPTQGNGPQRPEIVLERAIRDALPHLASLLLREDQGFLGLTVKMRGPQDVVVVVKREGSAGAAEVLFGSGYDLCGALAGANGAAAANRWREDKPWTPAR